MEVLFDSVSIKTLGLSLTHRPEIPTAERRIEYINVEGRDGPLVRKMEYKDVNLLLTFSFLDKVNVRQKVREIRAWLLNKSKLSFSDDVGIYRIIKDIRVESVINDIDVYGRVMIDITLDPFEYIEAAPITLTAPGNINNPGTYFANPLISVYGTGNLSITIDGKKVDLKSVNGHITLDSELQEAHKNSLNMNSFMVGKFPQLKTGNNAVTWTGTVTKLVIDSRCRYV